MNNKFHYSFGPVVKILRMKYKMTQEELAHQCHVNKSTISNIELCKTDQPNVKTLISLATAFKIELPKFIEMVLYYYEYGKLPPCFIDKKTDE